MRLHDVSKSAIRCRAGTDISRYGPTLPLRLRNLQKQTLPAPYQSRTGLH